MDDIRLEKRTIQERLIIAKTLIETALSDLPPAEKKGEWIQASEMLPGKSGEYLVTAELENGNVMMLLSWYYFNDNAWSYPNAKVTAWMPLPEPYKGGEE